MTQDFKRSLDDELAFWAPGESKQVTFSRETHTVGSYLAYRMEELGITDYFAVPGDFNFSILDEILQNPRLRLVGCCNELNAAYAADGYSRARGLAFLFVTFNVGSLSCVNACAGMFAENLPVVIVSGCMNTRDISITERVLHHTTGLAHDKDQSLRIFKEVTCHTTRIVNPSTAAFHIDMAIHAALRHRKPVYIEIPYDISQAPVQSPAKPLPLRIPRHPIRSNPTALQEAVEVTARRWSESKSAVFVVGGRSRMEEGAVDEVVAISKQTGCGVAVMPDAKGLVPENLNEFLGVYWGAISYPRSVRQVVEEADLVIWVCPVFSDYSTVGFAMPQDGIIIYASQERPSVHIAPADYHLLAAVTFLKALRQVGLPKRPAPPRSTESVPHAIKRGDGVEKLTRSKVYAEVERLVGGGYASTDGKNGFGKDSWGLVVEVGDSWFSAIGVHLPQSTGFEMQFLYGSIGWSVGAYLGYALGIASGGKPLSLSGASPQAKSDQNNTKRNRVMAIVGDGSFQVGAQELSTAIRYGAAGVMMVVNNGGYAIEDQLHDGPYNRIQNWRFADLVSLFSSAPTALNPAHAWSAVCHTGADLERVMERVHGDPDGLALIEVVIPTDDVTKELAEWGGKVGAYTKRVG